jgi:hypothetical protein
MASSEPKVVTSSLPKPSIQVPTPCTLIIAFRLVQAGRLPSATAPDSIREKQASSDRLPSCSPTVRIGTDHHHRCRGSSVVNPNTLPPKSRYDLSKHINLGINKCQECSIGILNRILQKLFSLTRHSNYIQSQCLLMTNGDIKYETIMSFTQKNLTIDALDHSA